jgi:TorA maturation chaperone TorD
VGDQYRSAIYFTRPEQEMVIRSVIAELTQQKKFFNEHMRSWLPDLCSAIEDHPQIVFYKSVAGLARAFFEVESYAMDMVE